MPVRVCLVPGCDCSSRNKPADRLLYSFPESPTLRNAWLRLLRIDENAASLSTSNVCSKHFEGGRKTKENKLPIIDIGLSEIETRRIMADYLQQVVMRSQRPFEQVIEDAVVFLAHEEEYEFGNIGEFMTTAEENAVGLTTPSAFVTVGTTEEIVKEGSSEDEPERNVETRNTGFETSDEDETPSRKRKPSSPATPTATVTPMKRKNQEQSPVASDWSPGSTAQRRRVSSVVAKMLARRSSEVQTEIVQPIKKFDKSVAADFTKGPDRRVTSSRFQINELNDKQFRLFTGVKREAFNFIFQYAGPLARAATYWFGPKRARSKGGVAFYISLDDDEDDEKMEIEDGREPKSVKSHEDLRNELFLTLMKLRTNITYHLLGFIFGWSVGKVSSVFHTWIDILQTLLKRLIVFPKQAQCWSMIPSRIWQQFPRLRCIVDCTEIGIQRPQQTYLQAVTFSHYKKRNTVKILVAIRPDGCISFVSSAYTGRASDRHIMDHSGLMDLLARGDTVLADRGFTITDELLVRGIDLNAPPAATGRYQFTSEEVVRGQKIAKVRIYVEMVIGRMKVFKILNDTLPISFVPIVDKMMIVISALCNLQPALVTA